MATNPNRIPKSRGSSDEHRVASDASHSPASSESADAIDITAGADQPAINRSTESGNRRTASVRAARPTEAEGAEETLQSGQTQIVIETPPVTPPEKEKRTRRAKVKPATRRSSSGGESAQMLLQTVETFIVVRFGEEGRLSAEERMMIEPSLTELIEKYGDTVERYSGILSLIPLVVGVMSYANRLAKIETAKGQTGKSSPPPPPRPTPPPPESPPPNGNHVPQPLTAERFNL